MKIADFLRPKDIERFHKSIQKTETCWLWTGPMHDKGYGTARSMPRVYAHRASYFLFKGVDPGALDVLHTCDTPRCINPDHLFLGTQSDNTLDRHRKGRTAKGEDNGKCKLYTDIVVAIKQALKERVSVTLIAKEVGVTTRTIYDIKIGRTWSHIPNP